jgi:hypothetical protein
MQHVLLQLPCVPFSAAVLQELTEAEAKLPPIPPPSPPAHLLSKALADLQRTDSALSDSSTCATTTNIAGSCNATSAGSPLRGSPKTKKVAIRRKGLSPRLGLGLGRQVPGGKRRRSSSGDEGSGSGSLGAVFDAAASSSSCYPIKP